MDDLLNVIVDIGQETFVIEHLFNSYYKDTGRNYRIDYIEVLNDYLINLRNKEVRNQFNGINQIERPWLDENAREHTLSTLQAQMVSSALPFELIQLIIPSVRQCLIDFALTIEEVMNRKPIGRSMVYNFKVVERINSTLFRIYESRPGDDFIETTFNPWVYKV